MWTYSVNGEWDQEEYPTKREAIEHGELNNQSSFFIGQLKEVGYLEYEIINIEEVVVAAEESKEVQLSAK